MAKPYPYRSQPFSFAQQFGYAALLFLMLAAMPEATLLTMRRHAQQLSQAHPLRHALTVYAVHSWGLLFLMVAFFILSCGAYHVRGLARLRRGLS